MKPTNIDKIKETYKGIYEDMLDQVDTVIDMLNEMLADNSLEQWERKELLKQLGAAEQKRIETIAVLEEWD